MSQTQKRDFGNLRQIIQSVGEVRGTSMKDIALVEPHTPNGKCIVLYVAIDPRKEELHGAAFEQSLVRLKGLSGERRFNGIPIYFRFGNHVEVDYT